MSSSLALATAFGQTPMFRFHGGPGHGLGTSVAGAGDVDRDGVPDVVIGIPGDSPNGFLSGGARVQSGRTGRLLFAFQGKATNNQLGNAVAAAGDVDRDGHADLIVGAFGDRTKGLAAGAAHVFSGRNGRRLHSFFGDAAHDTFGTCVAGAGDLNRDGHPDVIVGASGASYGPGKIGFARAFSGKNGQVLWTVRGPASGEWFGAAVTGAGDLDRDGHADFAVGAPTASNNGKQSGTVYVYSGKNAKQLFAVHGAAPFALFGSSLDGVDDVNKDGVPDLIAGAPNGNQGTGSARVISGKNGGQLFVLRGALRGDGFGRAVSGIGDVHPDGWGDILVAAPLAPRQQRFPGWPGPGHVHVFSGRTGQRLFLLAGDAAGDRFGVAVGGVGDLNGDGRSDFVVGAHRANQARGLARVYSGTKLSLATDTHMVYLSQRGVQNLVLEAGIAHAGKPYLLLGTLTGTKPGIRLGQIVLPLNYDLYFWLTLALPNSPLLAGSLGTLDAAGHAKSRFTAIPVLPPTLAGALMHHAYVVFGQGPFDFASNASPLALEK